MERITRVNVSHRSDDFLNLIPKYIWDLPLSKMKYFKVEVIFNSEECCRNSMATDWNYCPYCGNSFEDNTYEGATIDEAYKSYAKDMGWNKKEAEENRDEVMKKSKHKKWLEEGIYNKIKEEICNNNKQ